MENVKYIPKSAVAARYSITTRTVDRWHNDKDLGFPKPLLINGRNFFREDELAEFDRQCARRAAGDAKAA